MEIVGIPANQMRSLWPRVVEYFESFEKRSRGEITAVELLHLVETMQRQCWIATDGKEVKACGLTRVEGNEWRTVQFDFCAGKDREEWRDKMVTEIEQWSRHIGTGRVRIVCRPGWTKELKALGYRETHRVLERNVSDE